MFRSFVYSWLRQRARTSGAGVIARMATKADYSDFKEKLKRGKDDAQLSARASVMLKEVQDFGICIVPNFWSQERCVRVRQEIDRMIAEYSDNLHPNAKADRRIYGANNISEAVAEFSDDTDLLGIANSYNKEPTSCAFTLAAYMPVSENNAGSGEGWHRDAFFRQIKAIIYLSNVGIDNGPFQLLRRSHEPEFVLSDMTNGKLEYMQYRINDENVARLTAIDKQRLQTCTAEAGTLILVDTSTIHRGKPITAGARYALTNYYFPTDRIDQNMYEKFGVVGV